MPSRALAPGASRALALGPSRACALGALLLLVPAAACDDVAYFQGFETLRIGADELAEGAPAHPTYGAYLQTEYHLDYGAPTPAELAALQPEGSEPAGQRPFVTADALEIAIQWTLRNESDEAITAFVLLDGANEFFDWNPILLYGLAGGDAADELPFPSLLGVTPIELAPRQVLRREFREDDLREAMFDLDVLTRFCGGPFAVLFNRSEVSDAGLGAVPPAAEIAGMTMLRLTLAASGPASLDYAIRVRDRDGVLFDASEDTIRYETQPTPYVPAGFANVPAGGVDPGVTSELCGTATPAP
jgi:hypothetical protein